MSPILMELVTHHPFSNSNNHCLKCCPYHIIWVSLGHLDDFLLVKQLAVLQKYVIEAQGCSSCIWFWLRKGPRFTG